MNVNAGTDGIVFLLAFLIFSKDCAQLDPGLFLMRLGNTDEGSFSEALAALSNSKA